MTVVEMRLNGRFRFLDVLLLGRCIHCCRYALLMDTTHDLTTDMHESAWKLMTSSLAFGNRNLLKGGRTYIGLRQEYFEDQNAKIWVDKSLRQHVIATCCYRRWLTTLPKGEPVSHGIKLPEYTKSPGFAFGEVKREGIDITYIERGTNDLFSRLNKDVDAKTIIYPSIQPIPKEDQQKFHRQYVISHQSYGLGTQTHLQIPFPQSFSYIKH